MKKLLPLVAFGLALAVTPAYADKVHDWHDLDKVHKEVLRALEHLHTAQAANHYDMGGHAEKAEDELKNAETELQEGIDFIKADKAPQ